MTNSTSDKLPLQTEHDLVLVRQLVRKLAQQQGFSLVEQTKFVTAASEIGRNTITYGGGGELWWTLLTEGTRKGVRLKFADSGPGIPDIALAMTDGWTSGKGMGLGLSGSKRLVNEFDIKSEIGKGTEVTVTRWK